MAEVILDVFALRHARTLRDRDKDPGIDPEFLDRLEIAASLVSKVLLGQGQITIFASPARRTVETAERLLQSPYLSNSRQTTPDISHHLVEGAFRDSKENDKIQHWEAALREMGQQAIEQTDEGSIPGLVLVTHGPVIRDIPHLKGRDIDVGHLGFNYFQITI